MSRTPPPLAAPPMAGNRHRLANSAKVAVAVGLLGVPLICATPTIQRLFYETPELQEMALGETLEAEAAGELHRLVIAWSGGDPNLLLVGAASSPAPLRLFADDVRGPSFVVKATGVGASEPGAQSSAGVSGS